MTGVPTRGCNWLMNSYGTVAGAPVIRTIVRRVVAAPSLSVTRTATG